MINLGFLRFWSVVFVIATTLVAAFKAEKDDAGAENGEKKGYIYSGHFLGVKGEKDENGEKDKKGK